MLEGTHAWAQPWAQPPMGRGGAVGGPWCHTGEAACTCWILDQFSSTDRPFMAPVMARKQPRKHGAKAPCETEAGD